MGFASRFESMTWGVVTWIRKEGEVFSIVSGEITSRPKNPKRYSWGFGKMGSRLFQGTSRLVKWHYCIWPEGMEKSSFS